MDQAAQIKEKIDIIPFIGEFIQLKKAGRNFKANCPFHNESTPSFVVSPERQIWHCFGCQKGGDVYSFLMEYERLDFAEALRILAKRTGVQLTNSQFSSAATSEKEKIYAINALAKEFYHFVLTKHHAGARALEYVKERGVDDKMIQTFQLGFAPSAGNALSKYLLSKKQYKSEDLVQAGLAFQKGKTAVDFFRGRLVFPLIDHRDNVVGFSGRVMEQADVTSKYINTRETLVYHKSEHFFGINVTKEAIKRENQAIVVEGEFDVISCFQHGISQVVAVKGTALTEMQVNLLARFANKVTFCFDGDQAGQEAIKKSLLLVEKKGLTATVIEIPDGKDPDESLKKDPGLFKKAVREETNVYDYLFSKTLASVDHSTAEGKRKASDILLPLVSQIQNEIIKEHYIRRLSSELDTSYESIQRELLRLNKKEVSPSPLAIAKQKRPKDEVLEEYLVALLVQDEKPKRLIDGINHIIVESMPHERSYQKIVMHLRDYLTTHEVFNSQKFADSLPKELLESYNTCFLLALPLFEDEVKLVSEVKKTASKLRVFYIQQHMRRLAKTITEKEEEGNDDEASELKKTYSALASQLDTI